MQKLITSMLRFSGAVGLYGLQQMEAAVSIRSGQDVSDAVGRMADTLNSLTGSLAADIAPEHRERLRSFTGLAEQVVQDTFSFVDAKRMAEAADGLIRQSTQVVSGWTGREPAAPEEEPALAADVLGA